MQCFVRPKLESWQEHTHLPRAWTGWDWTLWGAVHTHLWQGSSVPPGGARGLGTVQAWAARGPGGARWEAQGRKRAQAGGEGPRHRQAAGPLVPPHPLSCPVQDIVFQLQRFVSTMSKYYNDCYAVLRDADVFPIEVDLAHTTLAYGPGQDEFTDGEDEDEDDEDTAAREPSRDARGAAGPLDKGGSWCDS